MAPAFAGYNSEVSLADSTALVPVAGGALEVSIAVGPGDVAVVAAHPADVFGAATAAHLAREADATAITINPRGIGASTAAGPDYGIDSMANDLEAARVALGVSRWVVWGISGGGWIAQAYAHRHPHSVAALVLESTCACFRDRLDDPACGISPRFPAWRAPLVAAGLRPASRQHQVEAPRWIEVDGTGSVLADHRDALLVAPSPLTPLMRRALPRLLEVDTRARLPAVAAPALVIAGDADPVVPVDHVRRVADALPNSELLVVPGGGHVPSLASDASVRAAVRALVASAR